MDETILIAVVKEIDRIRAAADIYDKLKELLPDFKNDYLDAYAEIAIMFNETGLSDDKQK